MEQAILWAVLVLGVVAFFYIRNQTRVPRVRTHTLRAGNGPAPVRITHITDFHNNPYVDPQEIAERVREFGPDLIALTGDLISENTQDYAPTLALAKALAPIGCPMVAVRGNHELHNKRSRGMYIALQSYGVQLLRNETRTMTLNGVSVSLTGMDIRSRGTDYRRAREKAEPADLSVLLLHSPALLELYGPLGVDVALCGHTHGGQVRLPFIGAPIVPGLGLFGKWSKGEYLWEDGTVLYVDSGLGNTRLDLRTMNPIQFTNVTITHR